MPYRYCTLYSGSGGNAAYLETPGARILIDAGKSARALTGALASIGVSLDTIDAILITHEHSDHVSALEVLTRKHRVPVHMLYACALRYEHTQPEALCACLHMYKKAADVHLTVGDVCVTAFPTSHDSRASVGYRLDLLSEEHPVSVALATDMGYVSEEVENHLLGCEAVILESNHDENLLMSGPYPYDLKLRVRSRRGHLSNRACADTAVTLAEYGMRRILLAHLSEQNNDPDLALDETASALAGTGVEVRVASPQDVTMLVGEPDAPLCKQVPQASQSLSMSPMPSSEVSTV